MHKAMNIQCTVYMYMCTRGKTLYFMTMRYMYIVCTVHVGIQSHGLPICSVHYYTMNMYMYEL